MRDQSIERRGRLGEAKSQAAPTEGWRDIEETGSVAGIRALVIAATMFGRPFARGIVRLVAAYYALLSPIARRSVTDFRKRLGLPTGLGLTYRHVLRFAQTALDAMFFMRGRIDIFQVNRDGHHYLDRLRREKTGAILLGAHLGSFYAMRGSSVEERLPLHPIVYTKNAKRMNAVLESLDPTSTTRLIEIGESGQIDFMLRIRERLEAGALVAILGDRVQPGGRYVEVDFLGGRARLPIGPYFLASSLRRPVYFTAGIYLGANRYQLYCIPFADRIVLPRGRREEAAQEYAQQYADLVADFCRRHPDNWFNFFDFFLPEDGAEDA